MVDLRCLLRKPKILEFFMADIRRDSVGQRLKPSQFSLLCPLLQFTLLTRSRPSSDHIFYNYGEIRHMLRYNPYPHVLDSV